MELEVSNEVGFKSVYRSSGKQFNFTFNSANEEFKYFIWNFKKGYLTQRVNRIRLFGAYREVLLIKHDGNYKYYKGGQWNIIQKDNLDELDYIKNGNIPDTIPEIAWKKLNGEIEINYYIDELGMNEAVVSIETEPFTLAEEFDDQTIKIIEYTDNPDQEDSTITLATEPFTFYDEVGDSFDVLYYTDDPDKTEAELEINHNYSPLDELDGDFELVTWTMEEETEVQEELIPIFKEKFEDGDLYGVAVDLSKGTINIK